MGGYTGLPTLDIDFLKARGFGFDTVGGSIDGGRNGLGQTISIEMTGGPLLVCDYACVVHTREQHEYLNWLAARCNGSFRFVNVPIRSDWMGPFPVIGGRPTPIVSGIPHSDGSLFADGAGYSQVTVFATFGEPAALNAGRIVIHVYGAARQLRLSDWMATYHAAKGWRAWRYWETSEPDAVTETFDGVELTGSRYTLSIDVPLREAVTAGQPIELARPRCAMKFPAGFTLRWQSDLVQMDEPQLRFEEAF